MGSKALPASPEAFKNATWDEIVPYYEDLAARPLDKSNAEAWLADWSHFESLLSEASALVNFAYSCDTADTSREAAQLRFGTQISPRADEQRVRLQGRLVELGYERPGLETMLQRFRNHIDTFSEQNVRLFAELSELVTHWYKVIGALTVEWEGEEKTPSQLLPFLSSDDRRVRERAFKLRAKPYLDQRDVLADIFDRMYDLRQKVARNSGFANYRDYAHREKNRFDYSPEDCLRFHVAVEEAVLPAVERLDKKRKRRLNLDVLRPWDTAVDPAGRPALKPFDEIQTFIDKAGAIFEHVDPDFRGYYETMEREIGRAHV